MRSDIRIEAINLLTAIFEHDPYLDPYERSLIERIIVALETAHAREEEREGMMQTGIIDFVIPAKERST